MNRYTTYHSKLYRDFKAIGAAEYRSIVRYYEEHEEELHQLDFEEHFELMVAYTKALFETGAYAKHVLMANVVVEISIRHNVKFYKGEDIYFQTLFRKACSLYHQYELPHAEHILRELIKMDPYSEEVIYLLKKCYRNRRPFLLRNTRAAAMFFFLLTPFLIALDELVIRHFYPEMDAVLLTLRNASFISGCIFLVGGDLIHRVRAHSKAETFIRRARHRKEATEIHHI